MPNDNSVNQHYAGRTRTQGRVHTQTDTSEKKQRAVNVNLPPEGFVRRRTVLGVFGTTKSTLYRWIDEGRFPKPYKLGPGTSAWDVAELRAHSEAFDRYLVGGGSQVVTTLQPTPVLDCNDVTSSKGVDQEGERL